MSKKLELAGSITTFEGVVEYLETTIDDLNRKHLDLVRSGDTDNSLILAYQVQVLVDLLWKVNPPSWAKEIYFLSGGNNE